jgi:general secretion pathway protein A
MYLGFYGLREEPFGTSPDPRFLFPSAMHREAMASLQYCIETGRGFFALIAPPGMGKTTLLFWALEKYRDTASTAFLFNTQCSSREFIRFLLSDVGIEDETNDVVRLHRRFNEFLLANSGRGRRFILVVDEAQNLSNEVLETIRLLSDFETSRAKLIQIVLAGQPELDATLKQPGLSHLLQRISMISRIEPLTAEETGNYINHRLAFAGFRGAPIFSDVAIEMIARDSHGIPRIINSICFNALSRGYTVAHKRIDVDLVAEAIADLPYAQRGPHPVHRIAPLINSAVKPRAVAFETRRTVSPATTPATTTFVPRPVQAIAPVIEKSPTATPVLLTATAPSLDLPSPGISKPASELLSARPAAPEPLRPADPPSPSAIPAERLKVAPVTPGVAVPFSTSVHAGPDGRGSLFGNAVLALVVVLICCAAGGYFVVRYRAAISTRGQVESVNASSPPASTATESLPSTPVPAQPPRTNGETPQPVSSDKISQPPRAIGLRGTSGSAARLREGASVQRSATPSKSESMATSTVIRSIGRAPRKRWTPPAISATEANLAANGRTADGIASAKTPVVSSPVKPNSPMIRAEVELVVVRPQRIDGILQEPAFAAWNTLANGEVVLTATVNEGGSPENLMFIKGDEMFKQAAFDAVRQRKYRPDTSNGKPARMPVEIDVKFSHWDDKAKDQRGGSE